MGSEDHCPYALLPPACLGKTDSTCGARDHLNIDCMSTSSRNFSVELTFSSNSQSSCVQYLPFLPLRSFRQLRHPLFFKLDSSTSLAQAPAPAPASALAPVYTSHPSSIQPRVVALYLLPPPLAVRRRLCRRLLGSRISLPSGHSRLVESQGQYLLELRRKAIVMTERESSGRQFLLGLNYYLKQMWPRIAVLSRQQK